MWTLLIQMSVRQHSRQGCSLRDNSKESDLANRREDIRSTMALVVYEEGLGNKWV